MLRFAMNSPGNGNYTAGFAGDRRTSRLPAPACFVTVIALQIAFLSAFDFFEPPERLQVETGELSLIFDRADPVPKETAHEAPLVAPLSAPPPALQAVPDVPLATPLPVPMPPEEVPLSESASGEVPLPQEETLSGAASFSRTETAPPTVTSLSAPTEGGAGSTGNPAPPRKAPMSDAEYLALIMGRLEKNKVYPLSVRKRGIEGDITAVFTIRRDGTIADRRLADSSGHRFLAQAAFETIRSASPFPVMEGRAGDYTLQVCIQYRLDQTIQEK
jgi:protein TonB